MNEKTIAPILLALIIGLSGGYLVSQATHGHDDADTSGAHAVGSSHATGMEHEMLMIAADGAPGVSVSVAEDAKSGWNVSLETSDFLFTPENINADNVLNEGHAHLYIDGKKIARLYSPNFHVDGYEDAKTFRVTLNANNHEEYAVDGNVISAEAMVMSDMVQ